VLGEGASGVVEGSLKWGGRTVGGSGSEVTSVAFGLFRRGKGGDGGGSGTGGGWVFPVPGKWEGGRGRWEEE